MSQHCAVCHSSAKREARVVLVNGGEEGRRRYCLRGEGEGGKGTFSERWRQAKGHSTCMKWDSRGEEEEGIPENQMPNGLQQLAFFTTFS